MPALSWLHTAPLRENQVSKSSLGRLGTLERPRSVECPPLPSSTEQLRGSRRSRRPERQRDPQPRDREDRSQHVPAAVAGAVMLLWPPIAKRQETTLRPSQCTCRTKEAAGMCTCTYHADNADYAKLLFSPHYCVVPLLILFSLPHLLNFIR